jgi:hypothetical protein
MRTDHMEYLGADGRIKTDLKAVCCEDVNSNGLKDLKQWQ